jgi:hypothetical protein
MIAQCATSAVLFGAGDIIAQQAVERKQAQHDVRSMLVSRSALADLCAVRADSTPDLLRR